MFKKIISLLLVCMAAAFAFVPATTTVAKASNVGQDMCGLTVHTCDYHYNGKVYTEAFNAYGKHAYNANPACNLVPINANIPPDLGWRVTAGYRVFPYSTDMIISGTCPNCTIRICCGGETNHWSAVETYP